MFEVYDDDGRLQISSDAYVVHEVTKYNVTGNFKKKNVGATVAIQPPVGVDCTIYPTQASNEDTHSFVITGPNANAPMIVREYANNNNVQSTDPYGLALYDATGRQTYHSSAKLLRVKGEFRSALFGIPNNEHRINSSGHYINSTRFLNSVNYPPGCNPSNTALFLSSVGCEGGMCISSYVGAIGFNSYVVHEFYKVRPLLRVSTTKVEFGFSSEFITSRSVNDDDTDHYYDGGVGHIHGFFVDVTNY